MVPTKATYSDAKEYQTVLLPLLQCEAATSSVNSDSTGQVILQNVSVQWNGNVGEFTLSKILCVARGLKLSTGDFLCLRCHALPCIVHCCVTQVDSRDETDVIQMDLVDHPDGFSVDDLNQTSWLCSIEVIEQGLSFRRMISAVKRLGEATELIRSVFLRRNIPKYLARAPMLKGQRKEDTKTTLHLNPGQEEAVKNAVNFSFTLIQGPPGTGKTYTGVEVACQFAALNRKEGNGGQVLFCAPSNHAVDVAARILQTTGLKVLRIYGKTIEHQTFKQSLRTNLPSVQSVMDKNCEDISLHFRVRKRSNPHSSKLKSIEDEVMQLKKRAIAKDLAKNQERNTKDLCLKVQEFYHVLDKAERHEIAETGTEVILCTCIEAGSSRVKRHARVCQVIIDEASMCLEPESLVALNSAGKQVVLLGDHKQLGAVIMSSVPRKLGLGKSLFDVLFNVPNAGQTFSLCKLQTQYRMHPSIREFPSKHFYEDLLKDSPHLTKPKRVSKGLVQNFWPGGSNVRVVFCHVVGTEESPQDYTGPEGREESKHNPQEVNVVLRVVKYLMSHGISSSRISVITPYSAQRAKISRELQSSVNSCDSEVLSVFASQGAEKDFVVLSTVRSLPVEQITGSSENQQWLANHLGFLIDERQMNVALTRAKHGLIIIGNRHLLAVHNMWNNLVSHCQRLHCLVDEKSWQPAKNTS